MFTSTTSASPSASCTPAASVSTALRTYGVAR
jgi:hypothetical protein